LVPSDDACNAAPFSYACSVLFDSTILHQPETIFVLNTTTGLTLANHFRGPVCKARYKQRLLRSLSKYTNQNFIGFDWYIMITLCVYLPYDIEYYLLSLTVALTPNIIGSFLTICVLFAVCLSRHCFFYSSLNLFCYFDNCILLYCFLFARCIIVLSWLSCWL
jgi:hypothetical protein